MNSKNTNSAFKRKYVYFEKQSNDRLCGLHCLNSLLQGPFFDPVRLSEIGLKLNDMELSLLNTHHKGFHKNKNVDDDGNYNIQVLTEALKIHKCEIRNLKKGEASLIIGGQTIHNFSDIDAFIFNSSTHWFAIRKIENIWFNLNSTNSNPGPEIISDFYLSAFIQGTEDIGYSNFMIFNLPRLLDINAEAYKNLQPHQRLVSYEDIINAKQLKQQKDKERNKANDKVDPNKFQAFQGQGHVLDEFLDLQANIDMFEDDEALQAYQLSMIEYAEQIQRQLPPEPPCNGYMVAIRYNQEVFTRKWSGNNTIKQLKLFVQSKIPTTNPIELFEQFPRKVFSNDEATLIQAGFSSSQIIMAKLI